MIRLLKLGARDELSLETFGDDKIPPPYAILSHTWGVEGDEVIFKDLKNKSYTGKPGYNKIRFCGAQARKDRIQYFWVDTCCIDKANHAELSEAITSMFRWYHDAVKCYVYLSDISTRNDDNKRTERIEQTWKSVFGKGVFSSKRQIPASLAGANQSELKSDFRASRWFTRGWTLQELIAPKFVEFFSHEGELLGDKKTLERQIHEITQIPVEALCGASLSQFSVDERLRWAEKRETKRKEDKAYCLLGIFGVFMPLIYGEGENAIVRLKKEIHHASRTDHSNIPPLASFTVPFRRDPHFIDRPDLLSRIRKNCSLPAARTAILGLGGVGKSQLAIEFCYRVRDEDPQTWIFWVHASNADRFRQGYGVIAETLQLPGRKDPGTDILNLVHDWLRYHKNGKWLLVLDNVDDATFLVNRPSTSEDIPTNSLSNISHQPLIEYVPVSQNGSVLITSRAKDAALKLVEASDIVEVSPMEEEFAVALIEKKLDSKAERKEMLQLAQKLECMPLAMVQATSYIAERWPRCSIPQYIAELEKNKNSRTSLLNYEAGQLRRDRDAKNSIIVTWQISFDHIYNVRRSAADLLSLMSFFDRQGIPEMALCTSSPGARSKARHDDETTLKGKDAASENVEDEETERVNSSDEESESYTRDQFEQDVLILRQFSFVSLSTTNNTFEMHRLVQLATQIWLEAHGQFEYWKCSYISRLCSVMPTGDYENWETWRVLVPHAKIALAQQPRDTESQKKWSEVLYRTAWYAWRMGNSLDAEVMARKSMKTRQKLFGQEHKDTLISMAMVGLACELGGRWPEAEELNVQVMETQKRVLGEEHPDTLSSINNLAEVLSHQGKYAEAEQMHREVVEVRERVLGKEHPDTLSSMNNLAGVLSHQGKYAEAEQMHREVVEVTERVLGKEHPSTLTSMNNLAGVLSHQGKYAEAEQMHREVVEVTERVLGKEHPSTLTSMNNLALVLSHQGKYAEAEQIHREVVEVRERVLGKEHPDTLSSMNNLAGVLSHQGKYAEAEQMHREVVEVRERVLGKEHPDTLTSINNLAGVLSHQGKYAEAEQMHREVVEVRERVLGKEHPSTLTSMNNLALVLRDQGKYAEAEQMHREELEVTERVLGKEHPSTLTSMNNLALVLSHQGKYAEAEQMHREELEVTERVLGKEHPSTLTSMNNLALVLRDQGKYAEAEQMHREELEVTERVLGKEHPSTLTSMNNLALVLSHQGKYAEAEQMHREVVEVRERVLGKEHPSTLTSINNLAGVLSEQGKYAEAEQMHREELEVTERVLGKEHPSTLTSMINLAFTWKGQGRRMEALQMMEQCLSLRSRFLGVDHPHTRSLSAALAEWQMEGLSIGTFIPKSGENPS